jgi:hypothetical protein
MIFVQKGAAPLTSQQLDSRTQKYLNRDFPQWMRERSFRKNDGEFNTYMENIETNTDTNRANNLFNLQLQEYRKATLRLEKYVLSAGREESSVTVGTSEYGYNEETGEMEEIMETVVTPAIEALVEQVLVDTYDEEANVTGEEMVDNPLIVQDVAERAAAQSVIDSTPEEVKTFGTEE